MFDDLQREINKKFRAFENRQPRFVIRYNVQGFLYPAIVLDSTNSTIQRNQKAQEYLDRKSHLRDLAMRHLLSQHQARKEGERKINTNDIIKFYEETK